MFQWNATAGWNEPGKSRPMLVGPVGIGAPPIACTTVGPCGATDPRHDTLTTPETKAQIDRKRTVIYTERLM